jgi:hypothetical protein
MPNATSAWVNLPPDIGYGWVRDKLDKTFRSKYGIKGYRLGLLAQWLEQSAHNRLVPGSSPGEPTSILQVQPGHMGYNVPLRANDSMLSIHSLKLSLKNARTF